MHSFLVESALLTHGLASLSNQTLLEQWPGELDNIAWVDAGRVVVDISGEDKKKLTVPDLLALFSRASGSDEANDKMLLS